MKILRIIARLNVGGPARHVVWLTEAMQDDEFETTLIAGTVPPGEEDMGYFSDRHGVEPVFIEQMSRELSPKDIVSLWKVYRRILLEKPDIIHTHTAKAGTIGRCAGFIYRWSTFGTFFGRPRKIKLIHTYHGHIFHSYYGEIKTQLFLFIERTLARVATDKIIVISEQQKKEINKEFKVGDSRKFEVIPLGIDLEDFRDAESRRHLLRSELGADEDNLIVGIIGRLTEVKNHRLFVEAAGRLTAGNLPRSDSEKKSGSDLADGRRKQRMKFVVIGDGALREDLEKLANENDLCDEMVFLGNREDPDVFYAGLDVVALTSLNEGTPLSLIEAMANRIPVISTAVGGVVDLLGNAVDAREGFTVCERGIRVESGDAGGLARGIEHLANDPGLRRELGDRGIDFTRSCYDKSRLIGDIKSLYERLLNS